MSYRDLPETEPEAYDRIRRRREYLPEVPQVRPGDSLPMPTERIQTIVGERLRHTVLRELPTEQIMTSVHSLPGYFDSIALRMVRELVAFEQPDKSVTSVVEAVSVPLTWWDHFKYTYPRLCKRLAPPVFRQITTALTTVKKYEVTRA